MVLNRSAREAVKLDRSPQTEGSVLATLQRSPAVLGTLALPVNGPPRQLALSPDGRTLAVAALKRIRTLALERFGAGAQSGARGPDMPRASVMIAPDERTIYCAYRRFNVVHGLGATYLAGWSLPSGRQLSTARIDTGAVLAQRLIAAGTRLLVVDARDVTVFDTQSLRRLRSLAITPPVAAPVSRSIPSSNSPAPMLPGPRAPPR